MDREKNIRRSGALIPFGVARSRQEFARCLKNLSCTARFQSHSSDTVALPIATLYLNREG
jgi:hypothetical protein